MKSDLYLETIRNIREQSVKIRRVLPLNSHLRSSAAAISKRAKELEQQYRQLLNLSYPEQAVGEVGIRQKLEKLELAIADLQVRADALSSPKSFPQTVSYGNNYLDKFRKHAEQIRRTTGKKEIAKVSSPQGQEQIKTLIEEIVTTGETRQLRYMAIPNALWSRKGNAIVIRQSNGEFVTFLEAGKGAATSWVD
ncbi:hypothetical protein NIES4071_24180 [Calothrix sp. NIES-4071]|nr:hypothetical protein NIES4071_24180 [Calothrix sp. NIES-4071]BAZ56741.1 hypothetical protein NIES4105_24120 [Calothrix sp. NIES-4105]